MSRIRKRTTRKSGAVWQIIYMDLMTIMMVYFVILWSADQGKPIEKVTAGISMTVGDQTVRMVNLPGDVLFGSGQSRLSSGGKQVFSRLFGDGDGTEASASNTPVLSFDQGGLARRQLVIHGHTDEVGDKDENFALGYERAVEVYREVRKYSDEVPDHVVICTHADNSPRVSVPVFTGPQSDEQKHALRTARAKNRRIAIEDQLINTSTASDQDQTGNAGAEP